MVIILRCYGYFFWIHEHWDHQYFLWFIIDLDPCFLFINAFLNFGWTSNTIRDAVATGVKPKDIASQGVPSYIYIYMVFSHLLRGLNKLHDTRPRHISSRPHIWPARIAMGISGAGGWWRRSIGVQAVGCDRGPLGSYGVPLNGPKSWFSQQNIPICCFIRISR